MSTRNALAAAWLIVGCFCHARMADESTIFAPIKPLTGFPLKLTLVADGLVAPSRGGSPPASPGGCTW
jgi:hypothetical protein